MKKWENLPEEMRNQEVLYYYEVLKKKQGALAAKRCFDVVMSLLLLILLFPFMVLIGIAVKATSPGEVIFRQVRVTTYGKRFRIYKFRTMVAGGVPGDGQRGCQGHRNWKISAQSAAG